MYFVGIDWATKPKKTAAAVVRTSENGLVLDIEHSRKSVTDEMFVAMCTKRAWHVSEPPISDSERLVIAVDIPFGWPSAFADWVGTYRPGQIAPPNEQRFKYRVTETTLMGLKAGITPFPVSAQMIAMGARRFASVSTQVLNQDPSVQLRLDPRELGQGRGTELIEVYPAATMKLFLERKKLPAYKNKIEALHQLAGEVLARVPIANAKEWIANEDQLDAVVCALTAAFCTGAVEGWQSAEPDLPLADRQRLAREGWIFHPARNT